MNSFALLQDDVEDASDLSIESPSSPQKISKSEAPAVTVQDARAAREVDRKRDSNIANGMSTNDDSKTKQNDTNNDENTESKNDQQDDDDDDEKDETIVPKEKEMTLEEYLEKKAALSSGLTSLKSRGLRQANDGKSDGFDKMRVVRKEEAPEGPLLADLHVKEETLDDKQVKDSTRATVARNAEIQKFFQRDPLDNQRRRGDYRRGSGDRRNNGRGYGRGPNTNGRFNQDRNDRNDRSDGQNSRGGKYEPRGSGYRGGRGRGGRGGRGGYRGSSYRNGYGDGKYVANGNPGSLAPNVDDTTAFPSL